MEHSPARETNAVGKIARVLISDVEAAAMLGCSRTTIWRRVADGTLQKPIKLGGLSKFVLSEINATVEAAMAARNGETA
ncbi:MAG: DNA-binding protein [Proteobacteria bacterium]|nr:DNA-binding protein [Pseudomonadota bacterium]